MLKHKPPIPRHNITVGVVFRLWVIHILCICGVEVLPMITFGSIDSNIYCNNNQSNRRDCPRGLQPLGAGYC